VSEGARPSRIGGGRIGRPELIFFDLGDTLVRPEPSGAEIYAGVCRAFGRDVDPDELAAAFASASWDPGLTFEPTEEASFERIKAFDMTVLGKLGIRDLPDEFFRAVGDAFARREAWFVFPDVVPTLDALEASGIRRAVISNWVWNAPALVHDLGLAARFETLVISARVGFQKPAREIFQHALDATGVRAERALHVGDSYDADVVGARTVGIKPVLIDRSFGDAVRRDGPRAFADMPAGEEGPVVHDLYELLDLVAVPRPSLAARG
jgi:putative hydrolase of the HAD superfamily